MSDGNLTLGEFLRQERERRGITIEQVASATKIGIRQLHALESDQYIELPAKPFIRGFVNSYCRFIGLDSREVLTRFSDFIDQRSQDRPNREAGHSGYAFEKREGEQSRTILGVIMIALVLLGGIAVIFFKQPLKHHRRGHSEKLKTAESPVPSPSPSVAAMEAPAGPVVSPLPSPSPKSTPSPKPAPSPSPSQSPQASPSPSPVADPLNSGVGLKPSEIKHKLVFKALESTWVRYRVDERPVMQFVLKQGKALVLRAQEKVVVQIANPRVLQLSYNNQGYLSVAQARSLVTRQNDATLIFPSELAESIQEPFPGAKPLGSLPAPRSATPSPSPSPTP